MTVKLIVKYKKILSTTRQEVKYSAPKEFVFFQQLLYQTPVMRPIRLQRPPTKISTVRRKQSHTEIYASSSGRQHRCPIMFPPREKLSPCALSINQSINQKFICRKRIRAVHVAVYWPLGRLFTFTVWPTHGQTWSNGSVFIARQHSNATAILSICMSVCLSVRPSVTFRQGRLLHINDGANAPWKK